MPALALPLSASPASASAQTITVSGFVSCVPHNVEGVWVEVGTGNSGWATMTAKANTSGSTSYTRTFIATLPTNIRLHVGCGGTPNSWWSDNRTPSSNGYLGALTRSASGVDAECDDGPTSVWGPAGPSPTDNFRCSWGSYPGASAVCEFGTAGGRSCTNPTKTSDTYDWGYPSAGGKFSTLSARGFGYRNCTDYAAWRVGSLTSKSFGFTAGYGNATDWANSRFYPKAGFTRSPGSSTPRLGDLAIWSGTRANPDGHVGVVVNVGPTVIDAYNTAGTGLEALTMVDSSNAPNWYLHR